MLQADRCEHDIMAGVETLDASRPAIAAATEHWFCTPSPAHRAHHRHLVPVGR